jgi:lysophospholipase L1-like esterase
LQFTTPIPIEKSAHRISYDSKIVSLGSCFAVNISEKFEYFQFQNVVNPFGILFHPLAIEKFIVFALQQKEFTEADVFFHNERWHCFDAHSELSHPDKGQFIKNLNSISKSAHSQIVEASHMIITLGTSWIYRKTDSGDVVANCHKVPQKHFLKELLSVETIKKNLCRIIGLLQEANPEIQILFTISPVRHIKDGFPENQWSKANLISALHQTIGTFSNVHYFPSYEIVMDELRDYRFYAEDMIHPNQTAIDYIWEKFAASWIDDAAFPVMDEVSAVWKGKAHRAFDPDSESHRAFLKIIHGKAGSLMARYPWMDFPSL